MLLCFRKQVFLKTQVMYVSGIEGHQYGIKLKSLQAIHEDHGFVVPGNSQVPHHAFFLCLDQCLQSSVLSEDLINLVLPLHIMELPHIQVVGLEAVQALFQQSHGSIIASIMGLGRYPHLFAPGVQYTANVLLADPASVGCGGINIIYSQVNGAVDHLLRLLLGSFLLQGGLSTEAEDPYFESGLPECIGWHGQVGSLIVGVLTFQFLQIEFTLGRSAMKRVSNSHRGCSSNSCT